MLELVLKGLIGSPSHFKKKKIGSPSSFSWSPLRGPDYFFYAFDSLPFDRKYAF